jgi:ankyrin repeat protein
VEVVRSLFNAGFRSGRDDELIELAAVTNNCEMVRLILSSLPCIPAEALDGALGWAAMTGNAAIVQALIDAGADADAYNAIQCASTTGSLEVVRLLIAAGVSLDNEVYPGPALLAAATNGHVEVAEALIAAGARTAGLEYQGVTLLEAAARGGCLGLLRGLLADGPAPAALELNAALSGAAVGGHAEAVRLLLAAGADAGASRSWALLEALERGHPEAAAALLAAGAPLAQPGGQKTMLMAAAAGGCAELMAALADGGVDVNARGPDGRSALSLASAPGAVAELLRLGARVDPPRGAPVLLGACERLQLDSVRLLLDAGAPASGPALVAAAICGRHRDPAQTPEARLAVVDALLAAGAQTSCPKGDSALHVCASLGGPGAVELAARLVAHDPALLGARAHLGDAPLAIATWRAAQDMVAFLLDARADIAARNDAGVTALGFANLANADIICALIDAHADVNARDNDGESMISHILKRDSTDPPFLQCQGLAKLCRAGANLADLNANEMTALMVAVGTTASLNTDDVLVPMLISTIVEHMSTE